MFRLAVSATIISVASAGVNLNKLRHSSLDVAAKNQELRVCNAYPSDDPLAVVYKGKELSKDESLQYKECRSYEVSIKSGEKLNFRAGNKTGIFTVWDVPECDAVLLLVAHRREDAKSTVSFLSHAFCPAKTAQVAVIDTYNKKSSIEMSIADTNPNVMKEEKLSFDTVIGLAPGSYNIRSAVGKEEKLIKLEAKASESYVVLRTGWASDDEDSAPQELVVYPSLASKASKETYEKSSASSWSASMVFVSLLVFFIW